MAENKSVGSEHIFYSGLSGYGITYAYFIIHVILFGIGLIGILLNMMVIYSLKNKPDIMDVSKIFIINLARSDILNACLILYSVMYNLVHFKNYYECALRIGLITGINLSSVFYLLSLTFDRYFKIIYPYKYCLVFKEAGARRFCACVWLFCASMSLLPVLGWRKTGVNVNYCSFFGVISDSYLVVTMSLLVAMFVFMAFCYVNIVHVAFNQTRKMAQIQRYPGSAGPRALWWGPTKTVLILTVFYFICWAPLGVCVFLYLLGGFPNYYTNDNKGTILAYCSSLLYLNVLGNPIIYTLKIRAVKSRARELVTIFRQRIKPRVSVMQRTSHEMSHSAMNGF